MKNDYVTKKEFAGAMDSIDSKFIEVDERIDDLESKLNKLHSEVQGLYPFISEQMNALYERILASQAHASISA